MVKKQGKIASIFIASAILTACSTGKADWPNLSDPVPDALERQRAIETSGTANIIPGQKPSAPERPSLIGDSDAVPTADPTPESVEEATTLFQNIKKALREETLSYRETKAKLADSDNPESKQDAWFAAQLALTRLSRTASRLETIVALKMPDLAAAAISESDIIDRFVVGERQFLMDAEPEAGRHQ
ncbi:MAG: hypothetical protein HWE25_11620 [Alphaproteobacteria bacterium]|nr:hypothetical protein [Alphaproteobacteria bacterium]